MNNQLTQIITSTKQISVWEGILNLLHWDLETVMPPGGIEIRSQQCEQIEQQIHRLYTDPKLSNALTVFIDLKSGTLTSKSTTLTDPDQRQIKEIWRNWKQNTRLPTDFIKQFSALKVQSQFMWEKAKTQNQFDVFAPYLEKIIALSKKKADYLGWESNPYDALLDEFEPGLTTKQLDPILNELKNETIKLLKTAQPKQKHPKYEINKISFDIKHQEEFCKHIAYEMGFNQSNGRMDISAHPFTTQISRTDVRFTSRYTPQNITSAISTVMHETGHALYEQNLNPAYDGTPLSLPPSMSFHESQSRLWENIIGKNKPFWKAYYKRLVRQFPNELTAIKEDQFYQYINTVKPSLIRVDADELTYNLHIIIRYEIEKMLFTNKININDLPQIWNQKYEEYLGLCPSNNAEGILQDVHWSMGYFGYFPSYSLGNLIAVQLYHQMLKDIPTLEADISQGKILKITNWLKEEVYPVGRQKSAEETLISITGSPLSTKPFLDYLNQKFQPQNNLVKEKKLKNE